MEKAILFAIALTFIGITSCKKCQTCTTSVSQQVFGFEQNISNVSEEYCGDEYDNAPEETNFVQDVGGVQQTVTITCSDN